MSLAIRFSRIVASFNRAAQQPLAADGGRRDDEPAAAEAAR